MSTCAWAWCWSPAAWSAPASASGCSRCCARLGQIDLVISLAYVLFLGTVGGLMLVESVARLVATAAAAAARLHQAPSASLAAWPAAQAPLPPLAALHQRADAARRSASWSASWSSIMGVGGGFLMVPAMIYLIGMPTAGRGRHVAVSDHLRHRGDHLPARGQQPDGGRGAGAGPDRRRRDRRPARLERRRAAARRAAAHPAGGASCSAVCGKLAYDLVVDAGGPLLARRGRAHPMRVAARLPGAGTILVLARGCAPTPRRAPTGWSPTCRTI